MLIYAYIGCANIVGYQLVPVAEGYQLFTPTFKGVAGELDITTIEICDASGAVLDTYNDVTIQKMNDRGGFGDQMGYSYCPEVGGWNVDFEPIEAGVVTFKIGETICVDNNNYGDTIYFRVSGEVDLVNKNEIGQGYVLWGNATPVAFDLTDVQVVDADGIVLDTYNDITVQKMNERGGFGDQIGYSYCPEVGGWNIDFEPIEAGTVVLEPGEAVCIDNNNYGDTVYMKVPSPVKK